MLLWLDVHLSPATGRWIEERFSLACEMMRNLGMQRTDDENAFATARNAGVDAVVTKDADWITLVERHGRPPSVIRLTCGNCSNQHLQDILALWLPHALELVQAGEPLVEIGGL